MGLDAKLIIGKDELHVDRKYNIWNDVLSDYRVEDYISDIGIPVFMMRTIIMDMINVYKDREQLYEEIMKWLLSHEDKDYVRLINEHSEEY